ncbi:MAG TPA: hybrid sensor histidine kinase/response regulator [Opitutaceae bacterium]|nr:hybrid sensor histidine kinase/response regulator [Opitutaceae bacterium]
MNNDAATPGMKLLMVDDQDVNLRIVGGTLRRLGFEVVVANNGDKALALLESDAFDLILLDVLMPGRDGFEICRAIRADTRWSNIPIIFLSNAGDKNLIVRALEAGGVDYVTKPFNSAELVSRVRTHVALKVARDQLKQLLEDKEELLGILAHDLKNHLGGIKVCAHALHATVEKQSDAALTSLAANIHTGTDQMFAFVVEFLANCAAERDLTITAEPVWLDELVATVARQYEEAARRKRITLLRSGKITAPTATDPAAVNRILHNLISNAVKFSPAGTTVHVNVETDYEGGAICRVQDQGPGFTAEDKKKMFRRYQRLSAQPTADEPSTGLGLSIVKKLVERLGADIACNNRGAGGTTFILRFPPFAAATMDASVLPPRRSDRNAGQAIPLDSPNAASR